MKKYKISIDEYIDQVKDKNKEISLHHDAIKKMYNNGISIIKIHKFFVENNIQLSKHKLTRYINDKIKNDENKKRNDIFISNNYINHIYKIVDEYISDNNFDIQKELIIINKNLIKKEIDDETIYKHINKINIDGIDNNIFRLLIIFIYDSIKLFYSKYMLYLYIKLNNSLDNVYDIVGDNMDDEEAINNKEYFEERVIISINILKEFLMDKSSNNIKYYKNKINKIMSKDYDYIRLIKR